MRRTNSKSSELQREEDVENAGPSTWSSEDRMMVVARLHDLEVVNQRLAAERNQLQRQLNHVLHRLASDRFSEGVSSLQELSGAVRFLLAPRTSAPPNMEETNAAESSTSMPAPLASGESINLLSSLMESNGRFSAVEYSSLSDAFEDLNLRQDLVSQVSLDISTQNSSSPSFSVVTGIPGGTVGGRSSPIRGSHTSFPTVIYDSSEEEDSKEVDELGPAGMLVSGTVLDTVASSSTHPNDAHTTYVAELASSSSASPSLSNESESEKWRSLYVCIPPSTSYSLSLTGTSTSRSTDASPFSYGGGRNPSQPDSLVLRRPFLTSSLPTSPRRLTSRRSLLQCIEDAQKSVTRWLPGQQSNIPGTQPDVAGTSRAMAPSEPLLSPQDKGDLDAKPSTGAYYLSNVEAAVSAPFRKSTRTHRVRTRSHLTVPPVDIRSGGKLNSARTVGHPVLLKSIKRGTQTARVKVGASEDFLNEFFSCGEPDDDITTDGVLMAQAAAVSREFSGLFSNLNAYTCVRKHCTAVETIPADELQCNLDQVAQMHRLMDRQHQFDRLCREQTSSSSSTEVRSNIFILKSSTQSVERNTNRHRQPPQAPTVSDLPAAAASSTSTDYYSPPMEESINQEDVTISHRGRLMMSGIPQRHEVVRDLSVAPSTRAGKLARLSGRFKVWQTFWCVLVNKSLLFYREESEVDHWPPRKCIDLTEVRSFKGSSRSSGKPSVAKVTSPRGGLKRSEPPASFNVTLRSGRVYTLRGPSIEASSLWEASIRRALRRIQAEHIFRLYSAQLVISGWLHRYRRGLSHRVWCMLMGTFLVYSREPTGVTLTGYRDLSLTYLRCPFKEMTSSAPPVVHGDAPTSTLHPSQPQSSYPDYESSDSESDTGIETDDVNNKTLALWAPNRDPVYLVCNTDTEFERWRYHLTRACWFSSTFTQSSLKKEPEARFLQLWDQLVHPAYVQRRWHTGEPISMPLSRVCSEPAFERSAVLLSRQLASLANLSRTTPAAEVEDKSPVAAAVAESCQTPDALRLQINTNKAGLVKSLAQMCYDNTTLKDELYLQLIKQATPPSTILRTLTDVSAMRTEPTRRRMRMMELFCGSGCHDMHRRGISARRSSEEEGGRRRKTVDFCTPEPSKRSPPPPPSKQTQRTVSIITMWECISILSTLFLPSPPVLACLQAFLAQFTSRFETSPASASGGAETSVSRTNTTSRRDRGSSRQLILELCRFAAFCSDMLLRCRIRGGRKVTPSYFEVVAISLRNPYTHCLPFSLPIRLNLPSGYQVVSFDGTMRISQLTASVAESLGLGEAIARGLCLCGIFCQITGSARASGGPARFKLLYLEPAWNVCDVISLYEQALVKSNPTAALSLEDMSIDLVFMVQAVGKALADASSAATDNSTDRLVEIVAHQLHNEICSGQLNLIMRGAHYLELTALMCRGDHSDYAQLQRRQETNLTLLLHRYFPRKCINTWSSEGADDQALIELKLLLLNRWNRLCQETSVDGEQAAKECSLTSGRHLPRASHVFVRTLWRLHPAVGCVRQFACQVLNCEGIPSTETVWLAPSYEKISFLRVYTFDSSVTHLICAGYATDSADVVSGLACFKQISLANVISFGIQRTGAFFLVFAEPHRQKLPLPCREHPRGVDMSVSYSGPEEDGDVGRVSQDRLVFRPISASRKEGRPPSRWNRGGPQQRLEKLLVFIPDLCTVNELCRVLTFLLETA